MLFTHKSLTCKCECLPHNASHLVSTLNATRLLFSVQSSCLGRKRGKMQSFIHKAPCLHANDTWFSASNWAKEQQPLVQCLHLHVNCNFINQVANVACKFAQYSSVDTRHFQFFSPARHLPTFHVASKSLLYNDPVHLKAISNWYIGYFSILNASKAARS